MNKGMHMGWVVALVLFIIIVIAAFVPLAAGLYLLTTTAWTAAERFVIQRRLLSTSPSQALPRADGVRTIS